LSFKGRHATNAWVFGSGLMLKFWIAAFVVGSTLAGGGVSAAQVPTEATRWLIPLQGDQVNAPAAMRVGIYNLGAAAANVRALAFKNGSVLSTPAPVERALQPGRSIDAEMSGAYDFILVVADKPVTVTGAIGRVTTATQGQSGQIRGAISNGGNGDIGAYMTPFNYYFRQSVAAVPIGCANAPSQHFACSMGFSGISSTAPGADFRVRPTGRSTGQTTQTPGRVQ
jgi:hypothetical protein